MTGYTKLFGSIITSTIWREDKETKILWITMLALKNKAGLVEGSLPGLADMARLTLSETVAALKVLSEPDPFSRTKDFEGRRIQTVDGGWLILNHEKWRNKMNADERREYLRIKQAEHRSKLNQSCQQSVNKCQQMSTLSTHTYTDTYTDADADAVRVPRVSNETRETRVDLSSKEATATPNWLTQDDLWLELQHILPEKEIKQRIGLWISRIKENRPALYEAICDFKDKRNQRQIRNIPAWLTQRYQHFKHLSQQRQIIRDATEKLKAQL